MNDEDVTAVLLLSCRDQRGLVAAVSDFVYRNEGNITHADQHTDLEEGVFLQRVEWELSGFAIAREEIEKAFEPIAERFEIAGWVRNEADGTVRCVAQGEVSELDAFVEAVQEAMGGNITDTRTSHRERRGDLDGFTIR